tara:strand:+ start:6366 stop:7418 length:1053 start_codon:yes stop_codon:yes gene_type:complete
MQSKFLIPTLFVSMLFFLNSCATLPSNPFEGSLQKERTHTATIGGKGLVVVFLPSKPPLNELDMDYTVGLQFLNYNTHDVLIDNFILGSTLDHPNFNFPTLDRESILVEKAHTKKTEQGTIQFVKPGEATTYNGAGIQLRDRTIHYGPFTFGNLGTGLTTQFFVEMDMEYESEFPFQFCAFDLQSSLKFPTGCPVKDTISGAARLGFGVTQDPVIISSIKKSLLTDDQSTTKIILDITIQDNSKQEVNDFGVVLLKDLGNNMQQRVVSFDLEPLGQVNAGFSCTSQNKIEGTDTSLDVKLVKGKSTIRCRGASVLKDERLDYPYQISLRYPYYQKIKTPPIKILPTPYLS